MTHPDARAQTCAFCQQSPGAVFLTGAPCCAPCLLRHAQHLNECEAPPYVQALEAALPIIDRAARHHDECPAAYKAARSDECDCGATEARSVLSLVREVLGKAGEVRG